MFKVAFLCPGYESLGVEYLSGSLRQNGFDTRLFLDPILFAETGFIDNPYLAGIFSFRSKVLRDIKAYSPDIVCFSVISDNFQWACRWAEEVKASTAARVVFGGIHPTSVPDKVIQAEPVDYICLGEGDEAVVELAQAVRSGQDDTGIRNIWKKEQGRIFRNPVRPLIADLDRLPFPDKELFYNAQPVFRKGYLAMTSRGCAYSCSYCCNNVYHDLYGRKEALIRRRSVGNVVEELVKARQRYAPRYIAFADDCFNNDSFWLSVFLREYRDKVSLPFSCYLFPDMVDEAQVLALKEAGCCKVQFGLQVISPEKRRLVLGRPSSQDKIARAIDLCRRHGLFVVCDSILGFPDETEAELEELARFYMEHMPDHCENFWLRYYPGTALTAWALKQGYIDHKKHELIESGTQSFGLLKRPENAAGQTYSRQIRMLLMLFPFLSYNAKCWWLTNRRYRHIPVLPSMLMYILVRLFRHPPFDLNIDRTRDRYGYFMRKRLVGV
ncbi:MAG: radical SAM protein [Candidatus Omnitrophica bacterium]|nr:radical SAM protein [Candidatus Omnitrophota bacterium]